MNEPIMKISKLSLKFGKKAVINDLDVQFQKKESVVIAGRNGVGKSTLLRCIAGVLLPDKGKIIFAQGITRAKIGFISDALSLFEDWSLQRAIDFHCRVFDIKEFQDSLIKQIGLNRNQKIKNLSAGQRVIFHLSLILSQKPELLLIDEILHLIDPYIRELFLDSLIEVMESYSPTIVMVNHTFTEIEKIPERVLIMEQGRFIVDEPIDQLKKKIKKVVSESPIPSELPCIFKKENGFYKEYFVYPFLEDFKSTYKYEFLDIDLTEIIKAFLGGSYDKERIS